MHVRVLCVMHVRVLCTRCTHENPEWAWTKKDQVDELILNQVYGKGRFI